MEKTFTMSQFATKEDLYKAKCEYLEEQLNSLKARTCGSCRWWVKANNNPKLMQCAGSNGCELTGENFFCANYERK